MKKEVFDLWLPCIKSGTYKQGKGALRNSKDEYCVLGILADVAVIHNRTFERVLDKDGYYSYMGYKYMLPPKIVEWAGLKNPHGFCVEVGKSLVFLQDKDNLTLAQIAHIVEKNWSNL